MILTTRLDRYVSSGVYLPEQVQEEMDSANYKLTFVGPVSPYLQMTFERPAVIEELPEFEGETDTVTYYFCPPSENRAFKYSAQWIATRANGELVL